MDNILKLLLGVLGVAGLLTMLTSEFAPVEPVPAVSDVPAPAAPVETAAPVPESIAVDTEEYNFKIGEPTMDGKPIVDPESPSQIDNNSEAQSQSIPEFNGNYPPPAQPTPTQAAGGVTVPL